MRSQADKDTVKIVGAVAITATAAVAQAGSDNSSGFLERVR